MIRKQDIQRAISLFKDWDNNGRPGASRNHGSFNKWTHIIGGIVENAGWGCPVDRAELTRGGDVIGRDMRKLAQSIVGGLEHNAVSFSELIKICVDNDLFANILGSDINIDRSTKSKFAKILKKYECRLFAKNLKFEITGSGHSKKYEITKEND